MTKLTADDVLDALPECRECGRPALRGYRDRDGERYFLCSDECFRREADRILASRVSCPVCHQLRLPEAPPNGRPAIYCSRSCRSRRENDLSQAVKELGKDAKPPQTLDEARAADRRARLLLATWYGRADNPGRTRVVAQIDAKSEAFEFWGNHSPPKVDTPDNPAVFWVLMLRIAHLRAAVHALKVGDIEARERRLRQLEYARQVEQATAARQARQRVLQSALDTVGEHLDADEEEDE